MEEDFEVKGLLEMRWWIWIYCGEGLAVMGFRNRTCPVFLSGAVEVANENREKRASFEQQTVGRTRRIRKAQARKDKQTSRSNISAA